MKRAQRLASVVTAGAVCAVLTVGAQTAMAGSPPTGLQQQYVAAAQQYGVPEGVLLAVAYNESQWEWHDGEQNLSGGYGPFSLTDVTSSQLSQKGDSSASGKGEAATASSSSPSSASATSASRQADTPTLHTATTAAGLLHVTTVKVESDQDTNIRAGAALLASYAKALNGGSLPSAVDGWYGAVARYSGAADEQGAELFADDVWSTLRTGAQHVTADGQLVTLAAQPGVTVQHAQLARLGLATPPAGFTPECPSSLDCSFIPAAYQQNSSDPGDYGDYDLADRNHAGYPKITTIVLHDNEGTCPGTIAEFQNPAAYVSANYEVCSGDGHVTQMVPDEDVAWHAGNWYINAHAIGIEQEGYAVQGATWYTQAMYHSTASLVRYLAAKYDIPLNRQHIIGHDNVPGPNASYIPGMHWDPGPYWNWSYFMTLVGRPIVPTAVPSSELVTIDPDFATNDQVTTDCEGAGEALPAQSSSFVWLRTAPSATAPLYDDLGLHPGTAGTAGTTCADDWGDKASAGQQFVVAGRQGQWTAIWWEGDKVWFENPPARALHATVPSSGWIVRPKAGLASIPTYGTAYPEASAYPAGIPVETQSTLPYTIEAGQSYALGGTAPTDYYYSPDFGDQVTRTNVTGTTKYLEIQLGHRIAFVNAADVDVVRVGVTGR